MSGDKDHSYCVLRNIVPAAESKYNLGSRVNSSQVDSFAEDYRMMSFYFQDYYDVSVADNTVYEVDGENYTGQFYTLQINFRDQSMKAINALKKNLYDALYESNTGLESYYDYAIDAGNNNNYSGYFNNFFINGVESLYVDNPNLAPWISVPIIYNVHRDILLNTFEGDSEALLRDAANTTAKIAPKSGTLEQLEIYYNIVQSFYENFYGPLNYWRRPLHWGTYSLIFF